MHLTHPTIGELPTSGSSLFMLKMPVFQRFQTNGQIQSRLMIETFKLTQTTFRPTLGETNEATGFKSGEASKETSMTTHPYCYQMQGSICVSALASYGARDIIKRNN